MKSLVRAVLPVAALALSAAPTSAQKVAFERPGYRLSSIGERVFAVARVLDTRGRPVANAPITFRITDPSVATVSSRGEMVARKVGNTFVWAIAGRDSASAIVLVEQLAARFSFSPPTLKLDALGARVPLRIQASDAAGNPLPGGTTKASFCRSVNPRIATLSSDSAQVTAIANGTTYVRCADRGIADSLRIEVQQRPAFVTVTNVKAARKSVGDTFTVKVVGKDRLQREITDVRPTWASLNPSVVSVDPVTGKAQSRDGGQAKVIVQIGDVADTATIEVTGSRAPTFQPTAPVADATPDAAAATPGATAATIVRSALFKLTPVDVNVGEAKAISVTARDSTGNAIPLGRLTFDRGYDTTIALIHRDSMKVVGRREGSTLVVARLGAFVDTLSIKVHVPMTTAAFREPVRHVDSIGINSRERDSALYYIHLDSTAFRHQLSRLVVSAAAMGLMADHSTHPTPGVSESRSGFLKGGEGTLTLFRFLELSGSLGLGQLAPVVPQTGQVTPLENLTLTEAEGDLTLTPVSWIGLRAGYGIRAEKTSLATQTWKVPRVSLINRFSFVGDIANTFTAISVLPAAKYTGSTTEQPSPLSLSGEAGLELHTRHYRASITYYIEQFKFNNSPRVDEFSAVRFRLGLSSGRQ